MERKICDFLRLNGKSTALTIAKKIRKNKKTDKRTVNRHLYNLERTNQVFKTDEQPPVWDLIENKKEIKQTLKPEQKSLRDTSEEKAVVDLLRSEGLKANHIAEKLGQPKKTINKLLYSMEEKGTVKKDSNKVWTLSEDSFSQESSSLSDHKFDSGLPHSFDEITKLGEGGYGCVYKVTHKYDGKIYAVKRVVLTRKADSEVRALARLDHPNIVRYITCWPGSDNWTSDQDRNQVSNSSSDVVTFDRDDCEENEDDEDDEEDDDDTSGVRSLSVTESRTYLFIQMDFCEGGTLTNWIKERNFMEKQRIVKEIHEIFYEIITGVEYIHTNKLIHRDLKPDNILFGADGKVKIGDFGLVAAQTDQKGDPIERSNRGTQSYMSPEQKCKKNYDEKTDIFPLGLVWFVMIWKITTVSEKDKLWPALRDQKFPEGFSDSYPTESKLIMKMLSKSPERRPHAKDIKKQLEISDHKLDSRLPDRFDEITKLGEGGYGCVYKVKHKYDGKIYAVKKVDLTEKADSEVKALARLDHPNIVRYITCWPGSDNWTSDQDRNQVSNSSSDVVTFDRDGCEEKEDDDDEEEEEDDDDDDDDEEEEDDDDDDDDYTSGVESLSLKESASAAEPSGNNRSDSLESLNQSRRYLFIQMEFCKGGTLTNWIKERNFMEKKRIVKEIHEIFYEVITGVEYIHTNKLIHRDLKPDNILFGADGKVKIGDFGLVAAQTDQNGDPIERSNRGTQSYMSPEQENKQSYDEKTDIFPLGLIWFEMLWKISTGMERAQLWQDLRRQMVPEGFSDKYSAESKFIMNMLSYSAEDRPHAREIKENLETFFSLDQNLLTQKTI